MNKLISVIIPTIEPEKYLSSLFRTFRDIKTDMFEIIIINQSGEALSDQIVKDINVDLTDHILTHRVPAANARNLGASLAKGEYLFFLDDDAFIYSDKESVLELPQIIVSNIPDVIIFNRGEMVDDKYVSHWPNNFSILTLGNFPRFVIEWNIMIKKDEFMQLGGFPEIGQGSSHAALSGEVFVLMAKIIGANLSVQLCPSVWIEHPGLFEKPKSTEMALGYTYGAGYAVGLSLVSMKLKWKIYWFARVLFASLADIFFREDGEQIRVIEEINKKAYRKGLSKCRLTGFFDAIMNRPPKSVSWLHDKSEKIIGGPNI